MTRGVRIETKRAELVEALRAAGLDANGDSGSTCVRVVERGPHLVVIASGLEPMLLSSTIGAGDLVAVVRLVIATQTHIEWTAAIAHDARNILAIMTALQGVELANATEARALGERIDALLRRVVASPDVTTSAPCDIASLLAMLQPELELLAGPECALSMRIVPTPLVGVDCVDIERVVVNLVSNARDASAKRVHVAVEVVERSVVILVEDDGCGMDAPTLARAREPFFTTKPAGHGTGLGLASVVGIVRAAGGQLAIDSATGAGTRVSIHLPFIGARRV